MWSVIYTAITKKKPDITFFKGQFRIAQQCNSNGISLVYSDKCAQSIIMTGLDWLIWLMLVKHYLKNCNSGFFFIEK